MVGNVVIYSSRISCSKPDIIRMQSNLCKVCKHTGLRHELKMGCPFKIMAGYVIPVYQSLVSVEDCKYTATGYSLKVIIQ